MREAPNATIILISGKQGSGKTTLGDILETMISKSTTKINVIRGKFAKELYSIHDVIWKHMNSKGVYMQKGQTKDGFLLQWLGTEWGRAINSDIWVNLAFKEWREACSGLTEGKNVIIVDDGRFENEFDAIAETENHLLVRLEAPESLRRDRIGKNWRKNIINWSLHDLDWLRMLGLVVPRFIDYIMSFLMGRSITKCFDTIATLLLSKPHPSETGLDEYAKTTKTNPTGKFDMIFHSDQQSPEQIAREILIRTDMWQYIQQNRGNKDWV